MPRSARSFARRKVCTPILRWNSRRTFSILWLIIMAHKIIQTSDSFFLFFVICQIFRTHFSRLFRILFIFILLFHIIIFHNLLLFIFYIIFLIIFILFIFHNIILYYFSYYFYIIYYYLYFILFLYYLLLFIFYIIFYTIFILSIIIYILYYFSQYLHILNIESCENFWSYVEDYVKNLSRIAQHKICISYFFFLQSSIHVMPIKS